MTTPEFVETWNRFQWRWIVWWGYSLALLELADVVLRWRGVHVELVSQTARRIAFSGLTAWAFFLGSMTAHWVVTWHRATWEGTTATVLALIFWAVFLAYLLASWFDPTPTYWPELTRWLRYPPIAAVLGAVLALVCFPQRSPWFPGGPR